MKASDIIHTISQQSVYTGLFLNDNDSYTVHEFKQPDVLGTYIDRQNCSSYHLSDQKFSYTNKCTF